MKWYHNDYSQEALEEMQKEAEKRVQESRERARLLSGAAFPQAAQAAPPPAKPPENHSPPQNRQQQGSGGFAPQQCPPLFQQLFSPPNQQPCPPQQCNAPQCAPPMQNPFSALSEMLGGFGGDKLIILGVLWLLWNEHADAKLLLALVYIML